ncbi:MAG: Demethylrebeccamycin-D-glucose O-methyltransferase [Chlamydiae bacterium]|nr:Demethylrebeccamycin-D-glucose O-methyltransferase [Chlamydiota bacterium]
MPTRNDVYDTKKCEEITTFQSTEKKVKEVSVAEKYYDLVTDFYEVGWGKSFHYVPQAKGETFKQAILRYEMDLAKSLDLKPGMKVLDAGCGVGGPMINIAKATGCEITGITICEYQIGKAKKNVAAAGLSDQCNFIHGDFMDTKLPSDSFDAIFAIESTCHAPSKADCFKEMYRILKPGQLFGGYEWCVKPNYDKDNPEHRRVMETIEHTTQTQRIETFEEINQALIEAGFEVLEGQDRCTPGHSWCVPLYTGLRRKRFVRMLTDLGLSIAEKFKKVPQGSCEVAAYLEEGAAAFIEAEKLDIFTPNYFFLGRKPL